MSALELIASGKKPIIEIPIPLSPTELVMIKAPYPLNEGQWKQMISILMAYKPSLVPPETPRENETKES
jgi:hypothetical protein